MRHPVLVAAMLAAACRGDTPEVREQAVPAPASEPLRTPADACPDWSTRSLADLPPISDAPWVGTLDEVWHRVLEKHYDPTLGCVDWPAKRVEYAKKVAAAEDQEQAFELINDMLGELEQSHFRVIAGGTAEPDTLGAGIPPFTVRWIEEELVVTSSDTPTVKPGELITKVGERTVADLVEDVRVREPSGSGFAFALGRAATAALSCDRPGERGSLEISRGATQAPRSFECTAPVGERVTLGNLSDVPTRVEHRMIAGTSVGYLAFNVWMLPMVGRLEAALKNLRRQNMSALVLDLRGNPGGVGPMSVPVARLLLSQGGSLGKLQFRDFAQKFVVKPGIDPFTGPVALLVDEGTASTSEIFAAGMRDLERVTIVGGRPSAGAALPSIIEELHGGAILQYVVGDYHSPKGTVVEGQGVVPDVLVNETRAAFAAGRDPVLERAVELLQNQG